MSVTGPCMAFALDDDLVQDMKKQTASRNVMRLSPCNPTCTPLITRMKESFVQLIVFLLTQVHVISWLT